MLVKRQNKKSEVWFVVACEEEFYMPGVNIVYSGVGKIRAAMATQYIIDKYKPSKIYNIGTAVDIKNGKVNELDLGGGVVLGTGDSFVEDWTGLSFHLVDMEGYAIGFVCQLNEVDFECYKYASDTGSMADWEKSLEGCNNSFGEIIKSGMMG